MHWEIITSSTMSIKYFWTYIHLPSVTHLHQHKPLFLSFGSNQIHSCIYPRVSCQKWQPCHLIIPNLCFAYERVTMTDSLSAILMNLVDKLGRNISPPHCRLERNSKLCRYLLFLQFFFLSLPQNDIYSPVCQADWKNRKIFFHSRVKKCC